ncbi:MAG: hypothetical protein J0I66_04260, partial [Microbacterium sp.]|nr:hypothetical protein [Microbacterium sp.]
MYVEPAAIFARLALIVTLAPLMASIVVLETAPVPTRLLILTFTPSTTTVPLETRLSWIVSVDVPALLLL